jgi:hypothetical protein
MPESTTDQPLEARIHRLEDEMARLRSELVQARLDQWEGRVDELELQMHLGAAEVTDRMAPRVEELRDTLRRARAQAQSAGATAVDVVETLRSGVERAIKDLRDAVIKAKGSVTR